MAARVASIEMQWGKDKWWCIVVGLILATIVRDKKKESGWKHHLPLWRHLTDIGCFAGQLSDTHL